MTEEIAAAAAGSHERRTQIYRRSVTRTFHSLTARIPSYQLHVVDRRTIP